MNVLIINPNTTEAMTQKLAVLARSFLPASTSVSAVSGRFGPRYIASRATFAIAGHAALDAYAEHGANADCILLACYGDPGLDALREISTKPVIGLIEAAAHEALVGDRRFSIVTGGVAWKTMLHESLLVRCLSANLSSIRTVAPDGGMIARDPDGALQVIIDVCDHCIAEDGAEAIILGGAGLIGLAERIAAIRPYPVICSVMAGLRAVMNLNDGMNEQRSLNLPNVETVGLSPSLANLLLHKNST